MRVKRMEGESERESERTTMLNEFARKVALNASRNFIRYLPPLT
jgi:hypothetical protein